MRAWDGRAQAFGDGLRDALAREARTGRPCGGDRVPDAIELLARVPADLVVADAQRRGWPVGWRRCEGWIGRGHGSSATVGEHRALCNEESPPRAQDFLRIWPAHLLGDGSGVEPAQVPVMDGWRRLRTESTTS